MVSPVRKILVPIDFLGTSRNAVRFAVEIAEKNKAKVFLIHAYRLMQPKILLLPYFKSSEYTGPELRDELENYSKALFDQCEKELFENVEIDHEFITEVGFTAHAIESAVGSNNIDLVVMGTNNSNRKHQFWGSNTLEVIRKVKCPVLAIPDEANPTGIKKITLASDYRKVRNPNVFKFIKNLAITFSAEIQILNLSRTEISLSKDILQTQKEFDQIFEGVKHSYHFKSCDDFDLGMSEHLKSENTDILIIIPRDHNFFEKLFKRNLTTSVVLNTKIPLIAIHESA